MFESFQTCIHLRIAAVAKGSCALVERVDAGNLDNRPWGTSDWKEFGACNDNS